MYSGLHLGYNRMTLVLLMWKWKTFHWSINGCTEDISRSRTADLQWKIRSMDVMERGRAGERENLPHFSVWTFFLCVSHLHDPCLMIWHCMSVMCHLWSRQCVYMCVRVTRCVKHVKCAPVPLNRELGDEINQPGTEQTKKQTTEASQGYT